MLRRPDRLRAGVATCALLVIFLVIPHVSSSDTRAPISTSKSVFSETTHKLQPSSFFARLDSSNRGPLPTNKWWTNFFLGSGTSPAAVMPYTIKMTTGTNGGIQINYPNRAVTDKFIFNVWLHDISLETTEGTMPWELVSHDDLSVTVAARMKSGHGGASGNDTTDGYMSLLLNRSFAIKGHAIITIIAWNLCGIASLLILRYLIAFPGSTVARYSSLILSFVFTALAISGVVYSHMSKNAYLDANDEDVDDLDNHFDSVHTIMGLILTIAAAVHLIVAMLLTFTQKYVSVMLQSILLIILAVAHVAVFVCIYFGFVDADFYLWVYIAYGLWIASLFAVVMLFEALVRLKTKLRKESGGGSVEMTDWSAPAGLYNRASAGAVSAISGSPKPEEATRPQSSRERSLTYSLLAACIVATIILGAVLLPSIVFSPVDADFKNEPVPPPPTNTTSSAPKRSLLQTGPTVEPGSLTLHLVQGSPYITAKYGTLTPMLRTQHAVLSVNDKSPGSTASGKQFEIKLNNGQLWLVTPFQFKDGKFKELDSDMSFSVSGSDIKATAPFNGVLRVAIVPAASPDQNSAKEKLIEHACVWPVGGFVSYSVKCSETGEFAQMHFDFETESVDSAEEPLLMTALPHHRDLFSNETNANLLEAVTFQTIKGLAKGVLGSCWVQHVPLSSIGLYPPREVDQAKRNDVLAALREDASLSVPIPGDTYSFGKVASRFARLALIAEELNEPALRDQLVSKVVEIMDPWMKQTHSNSLMYDTTWGGLISKTGRNDAGAEYGQGWYNDQHYHYGYYVYAAAVVARFNQQWVESNSRMIEDLIRNIANTGDDGHFPSARHKDWYHGHSWASGLFEFADGKNQESTSESVNGYYGVYLWGLVTNNTLIKDWGRLLLATEQVSAQRYWHMFPQAADHPRGEPVYDEVFRKDTCVGIVWSTKVDYATWFGGNVEYIHGIQMLPYTPITEELLPRNWVVVEYPLLATSLTRSNPPIQMGWKGFVVMTQSIIDKETAWTAAKQLNGYDNGNSKTNTLHFIATRP